MHPIPELTDADAAFGNVSFLPQWEKLPKAYRDGGFGCEAAGDLFYKGGSLASMGYLPRKGVDVGRATRAIQAALRSFEPSYEHKIDAVGWLVDQWFQRLAPLEQEK